MKFWTGFILCMVLLVGGGFLLAWRLSEWDQARAEKRCAALAAEPVSVGRGKYLCVTSDGRVVS